MPLADLLSLFFPEICPGCRSSLLKNERVMCSMCRILLPVIDDYMSSKNAISLKLAGRLPIKQGFCFLYFQKEGIVQRLMHNLKYKNRPDIGFHLGELFGKVLHEKGVSKMFDGIIPVPLHRARLDRRGYNQSSEFAKGLSNTTGIAVEEGVVFRYRKSETQTRKSRIERIKNVEGIFRIKNGIRITGKRILMVDDVFTTGATLESCGHALLTCGIESISVATIAQAK